MASKAVRQAVQEALFRAPSGGGACRSRLPGRSAAGGVATVLQRLHNATVTEPLPPELMTLLNRVDAADRRRR
jgi:hypothetical protein